MTDLIINLQDLQDLFQNGALIEEEFEDQLDVLLQDFHDTPTLTSFKKIKKLKEAVDANLISQEKFAELKLLLLNTGKKTVVTTSTISGILLFLKINN